MKTSLMIPLLIFIVWMVGFIAFASYLVTLSSPSPPSCEAVVVFTGQGNRIQPAYALFQKVKARAFLISGVDAGVQLEDLLPKGSDVRHIDLDYRAYDTHTNALETAVWVRKHKFRSVCLVTRLYHMPRSLMELRRALPEHTIIPYALPPYMPWWDVRSFYFLVSEYHKYCMRYFFHQLS